MSIRTRNELMAARPSKCGLTDWPSHSQTIQAGPLQWICARIKLDRLISVVGRNVARTQSISWPCRQLPRRATFWTFLKLAGCAIPNCCSTRRSSWSWLGGSELPMPFAFQPRRLCSASATSRPPGTRNRRACSVPIKRKGTLLKRNFAITQIQRKRHRIRQRQVACVVQF